MAAATTVDHVVQRPAAHTVLEVGSARRIYWMICSSHFIMDSFSGTTSLLLAYISANILPMTNTEIGFAIGMYQFVSALSQPAFGLRTDHSGGRWLAAGGLLLTACMTAVALVAATMGIYALMVGALVVAAIGVGAFHPVGAMYAAETSRRKASGLSIFYLMGQGGSAVALVAIGLVLDRSGTQYHYFTDFSPLLAHRLVETANVVSLISMFVIAVPFVIGMSLILPNRHRFLAARGARSATSGGTPVIQWRTLSILAGVITLRSIVNPGIIAFMPTLFQLKGWTPAEYGFITALWWLAGGLSGVFFGRLGERFGSRRVIALTLLAAAPVVFALPVLEGRGVFVLAVLAGVFTGGSFSLIVAMAQQLMPAKQGFASGATQGFIFGTGALGSVMIGALSDRIGLPTAFQFAALALLATSILAWWLPRSDTQAGSI